MERKLAEYRASRRLQKEKPNDLNENNKKEMADSSEVEERTKDEDSSPIDDSVENNDYDTETECGYVTRIFKKIYSINFLLKFSLWFCLLFFFIEIQFGAVYFIVSLTMIMYFSMKNKRGKTHGPSAYSVFNKDCERIDGTFTAEQFERQMIYGGAVR